MLKADAFFYPLGLWSRCFGVAKDLFRCGWYINFVYIYIHTQRPVAPTNEEIRGQTTGHNTTTLHPARISYLHGPSTGVKETVGRGRMRNHQPHAQV